MSSARRATRGAAGRRGGLVVVAGKKGAWAKEFDPEYSEKKQTGEVDQSMWPGLESTCLPTASSRSRSSSRLFFDYICVG